MEIFKKLKREKIKGRDLELLAEAFGVNLNEDLKEEGLNIYEKYGKIDYSNAEEGVLLNVTFVATNHGVCEELARYQGSLSDLDNFNGIMDPSIYLTRKIKKQLKIPYSDLSKYLQEEEK